MEFGKFLLSLGAGFLSFIMVFLALWGMSYAPQINPLIQGLIAVAVFLGGLLLGRKLLHIIHNVK